MKYTKIIPCLSMENPIEEALYYNDAGADEIAFFDIGCSRDDIEKNVVIIKEIMRRIDIPLVACGGIRRFEDAKKLLYAGASKVCMKTAPIDSVDIVKEVSDRFGSDRVMVAIDLNICKDPVAYSERLKEAGAGELLLICGNDTTDYEAVAAEIKRRTELEVIIETASGDDKDIIALIEKSCADGVCLNNKTDLMSLKHSMKDMGISVNLYESSIPFDDFKLNSDGLIPVVTQDYKTGEVLMLAYMNKEAYELTVSTGRMTYFSRSRNELWTKGETSGHFQYVKSLTIDCDKDTILAKVSQVGVACHTGNPTCFFTDLVKKEYKDTNPLKVFKEEYDIIVDRRNNPKEGSYTNYLFDKGIDKILKKVGEEATEIVIAAKNPDAEELKYEISDFLYHVMVLMVERGVTWEDVIKELADRR